MSFSSFWQRQKKGLFRDRYSSSLTLLLSIAALYFTSRFLSWSFFNADFEGESRLDCTSGGACWVFVKMHLSAFLYGSFYPKDETWRPLLLFFLLIALPLIALFSRGWLRKYAFLALFLVLPPLGGWLLLGGAGLTAIESSRIGGLSLTLVISYVGILSSLPFGILLALGRRSSLPMVKATSIAFIEFWRGVPLITVLFMASVMLPLFLPQDFDPDRFDKLFRCLIGVTLFSSAYMAEVVRGGLQSIEKGQYEAAKALSFSYFAMMRYVILPQALSRVIPGIVNNFIGLFKDTTLVMIIGMFDLLGVVQSSVTNSEWLSYIVEGYLFAGFIFWVFCFGLSRMSVLLERRYHH